MRTTFGWRNRWLLLVAAALGLGGCAHASPLPQGLARRLGKVAVIARRAGPPVSYVARGDALAAHALGGNPVVADGRIEAALDRAVSVYELEQLVRGAVVSHLAHPPFAVADPLAVSSALGSLLARGDGLDLTRLAPLHVDAALVLRIVKWGVRKDGAEHPGGFWMTVDARLRAVPDGGVLWSSTVSVDFSANPGAPAGRFSVDAWRAHPRQVLRAGLAEVADAVGVRLARLLQGRPLATPR